MASYKNVSSGKEGKGGYLPIGDNKAHVPPAGASNSYEKVNRKLMSANDAAVNRKHYSRAKMENK